MYNITIWVTEIRDILPKIDSIFACYLPFRANRTGLNHQHWFNIRETTKPSTTMHTWHNRVSTGHWCSVKLYVGFFLLRSASGPIETWDGPLLYCILSIVCRSHLKSKMIQFQQYTKMILLPFKLNAIHRCLLPTCGLQPNCDHFGQLRKHFWQSRRCKRANWYKLCTVERNCVLRRCTLIVLPCILPVVAPVPCAQVWSRKRTRIRCWSKTWPAVGYIVEVSVEVVRGNVHPQFAWHSGVCAAVVSSILLFIVECVWSTNLGQASARD